jgi:general secretion pathway protein K
MSMLVTRYSVIKPIRRESGIALVMVLWLVVLLTIVAASFATHSRVETRIAGNLVQRQHAKYMTETGFNRAIMELLSVKSEESWRYNGQPYEIQSPQGNIRISIRSSAGLVDLNRASRQTLSSLFKLLSEDGAVRDQLADALEDWRDGDDARRANGAEDADYTAAGFAYGAADRNLETVDELGYVMGFDRDSVDILRPYVTVHSGMANVDYNFASEELTTLLKGRVAADSSVAEALSQIDGGLVEFDESDGMESSGQGPSRSYRISIQAVTAGGGRSAIDVDIEMNNQQGKPPTILAWHDAF